MSNQSDFSLCFNFTECENCNKDAYRALFLTGLPFFLKTPESGFYYFGAERPEICSEGSSKREVELCLQPWNSRLGCAVNRHH